MDKLAAVLQEKIRRDLNEYADVMANGGCADYAAYREMVGLIRGLGLAEAYLLELVKKAHESDED